MICLIFACQVGVARATQDHHEGTQIQPKIMLRNRGLGTTETTTLPSASFRARKSQRQSRFCIYPSIRLFVRARSSQIQGSQVIIDNPSTRLPRVVA
jgi:hypothetical protein